MRPPARLASPPRSPRQSLHLHRLPPSLPPPACSDDIEGDQRLPHDSGEQVTVDQLKAIGVLPFPGIELDQVETMCVP